MVLVSHDAREYKDRCRKEHLEDSSQAKCQPLISPVGQARREVDGIDDRQREVDGRGGKPEEGDHCATRERLGEEEYHCPPGAQDGRDNDEERCNRQPVVAGEVIHDPEEEASANTRDRARQQAKADPDPMRGPARWRVKPAEPVKGGESCGGFFAFRTLFAPAIRMRALANANAEADDDALDPNVDNEGEHHDERLVRDRRRKVNVHLRSS